MPYKEVLKAILGDNSVIISGLLLFLFAVLSVMAFILRSLYAFKMTTLPTGVTSGFRQEEGKKVKVFFYVKYIFSLGKPFPTNLCVVSLVKHRHVAATSWKWLGKLNIQLSTLCSRRRQGRWKLGTGLEKASLTSLQ